MDSLADYGSDEERAPHHRGTYSNNREADRGQYSERGYQQHSRKDDDTNYDHVTMDMSEESNNNNSDCESPQRQSQRRSSYSSGERDSFQGGSSPDDRNRMKSQRQNCHSDKDSYKNDKKYTRNDESDKQDRHNNDRRDREGSDKREFNDRRERDNSDKRGLDRDHRDNDRHRYPVHSRDRYDRKYPNDDKRSNNDRRRERSRSHDRNSGNAKRRSSSGDRDRSSRSHHSRYSDSSKRSNSREKRNFKRSRSRDKSPGNTEYKPSYKVSKKLHAINKMGLQIKTPDGSIANTQMLMQQTLAEQVEKVKNATGIELPKYYNPSVMNPLKYANQIQKRKLLWGNKGKEMSTSAESSSSQAPAAVVQPNTSAQPNKTGVSKWQGTKFAQDSDGKVASKFMRLMGIKDGGGSVPNQQPVESSGDIVKKQEEMFEAMQAQYEVARATTHTMRGVGLGFSSHNKPY